MMSKFEQYHTDNLLLIHDLRRESLGFLQLVKNTSRELVLNDMRVLTFDLLFNDRLFNDVNDDGLIKYKNEFWIVSNADTKLVGRKQEKHIVAESRYVEIADFSANKMELDRVTIRAGAEKILRGTGWEIGEIYNEADGMKHSMLEARQTRLWYLWQWAKIVGRELEFDTVNRVVHFRKSIGVERGVAFEYKKNIKDIQFKREKVGATVIYPYGKGGLTIASINNGQDYIEDYSWYLEQGLTLAEAKKYFKKEILWEDERFLDAYNLKVAAEKKLKAESRPKFSYMAKVMYLLTQNAEIALYDVGDWGVVRALDMGIDLSVRLVRMKLYDQEPWKNEVEFNYYRRGIHDYLADSEPLTSTDVQMQQPGIILAQNSSTESITQDFVNPFSLNITNYSSTNALAGFFLIGNVSFDPSVSNVVCSIKLQIDGKLIAPEIKQNLVAGYNTISLPMVVLQIPQGSNYIDVFVKCEGGTLSVSQNHMQLYLYASNILGGASSESPRANIVEEVEFINPITVGENVTTVTQVPIGRTINENVSFDVDFSVIDTPTVLFDGIDYNTQPPATPTGIVVDRGINGFSLAWDANTDIYLAGYNVYIDGVKHNKDVITDTTYYVTGLQNGETYNVKITSISVWGYESEPFETVVTLEAYNGNTLDDFLNYFDKFTEDKPSRSQVETFVSNKTADGAKYFCYITINYGGSLFYVLSTTGTYINVNNGVIESDGQMYSCDIGNLDRSRGSTIDFSNYQPVVKHEDYEVIT